MIAMGDATSWLGYHLAIRMVITPRCPAPLILQGRSSRLCEKPWLV